MSEEKRGMLSAGRPNRKTENGVSAPFDFEQLASDERVADRWVLGSQVCQAHRDRPFQAFTAVV